MILTSSERSQGHFATVHIYCKNLALARSRATPISWPFANGKSRSLGPSSALRIKGAASDCVALALMKNHDRLESRHEGSP